MWPTLRACLTLAVEVVHVELGGHESRETVAARYPRRSARTRGCRRSSGQQDCLSSPAAHSRIPSMARMLPERP